MHFVMVPQWKENGYKGMVHNVPAHSLGSCSWYVSRLKGRHLLNSRHLSCGGPLRGVATRHYYWDVLRVKTGRRHNELLAMGVLRVPSLQKLLQSYKVDFHGFSLDFH